MGIDQPDLDGSGVWFGSEARAIACEGNQLAVWRPLRLAVVVAAAGELDLFALGKA
jgi:hypothetical protein